MIRHPIPRPAALALAVASILVLIISYTVLSERQHRLNPGDTTLPTWSQLREGVGVAVHKNQRTGERWLVEDAKASLGRLFLGLLWGVAGALILGLLMGCFSPAEAFLQPPFSLLAQIPPTAVLAVFFVLAGTGDNMYVAMIAFGVMPTLAMTVHMAVKEFPEELQFKAYTLGASHAEVILAIIFHQILPRLLDAFRLAIGPAMVYLIAAEMVVGDVGFGYRIRLQSKLLNMSVVYPYLACLAAFGFAMDGALRQAQRRFCPWYQGSRG